MKCPVCLEKVQSYHSMASHFLSEDEKSDPGHVMFLNRYISRNRIEQEQLSDNLERFFHMDNGFRNWIIRTFVNRFFGDSPHPFILENQHPKPYIIRGYAMEHHHFLWQWVRSCSYIIGNSDNDDVVQYEIENITSEWYGTNDSPSHHELLLRMGEAYGLNRKDILNSIPLPATESATEYWSYACKNLSWQEGMSAMHSLELIANRRVLEYGGKFGYFDPSVMKSSEIREEAKEFLKEGYLADVSHSERALIIIERHSDLEMLQNCQAVFMKSIEYFYDYLLARIERGHILENKQ